MQKISVNLLQAELLPQQPLWTLKRVVIVWFLAFLLMFFWMSLSQYQLSQLSSDFNVVNQQKQTNDKHLANLEKKVSQNKANPLLQEKLATVKLLLVHKKNLHEQLTDASSTYAAGFSSAMTELSQLHHQSISLQKVKMNADHMMFSGLAREPEAVPIWLAAFESSTFLSGKSFNHLSLSENEDKVTQFTVSSNAKFTHVEGE